MRFANSELNLTYPPDLHGGSTWETHPDPLTPPQQCKRFPWGSSVHHTAVGGSRMPVVTDEHLCIPQEANTQHVVPRA